MNYNYLLLSLILWFPPLHELGHYIIAKFLGYTIYSVEFAYMTHNGVSMWYWDLITIVIPFMCLLIYLKWYYDTQTIYTLENKVITR